MTRLRTDIRIPPCMLTSKGNPSPTPYIFSSSSPTAFLFFSCLELGEEFSWEAHKRLSSSAFFDLAHIELLTKQFLKTVSREGLTAAWRSRRVSGCTPAGARNGARTRLTPAKRRRSAGKDRSNEGACSEKVTSLDTMNFNSFPLRSLSLSAPPMLLLLLLPPPPLASHCHWHSLHRHTALPRTRWPDS